MTPFGADRLRVSAAACCARIADLSWAFEVRLRGAAPALAAAVFAPGAKAAVADPLQVIVAAMAERAGNTPPQGALEVFQHIRHAARGVPRADAILGQVFIASLSQVLGTSFDEATRTAWTEGFVELVEHAMATRRNRMDLVA